jgi:uncharacterized membrane-anchored protein YhcB (DUF1043 family)
MTTIIGLVIGIAIGYLCFHLGFKFGVIAAMARMEAIRVQMEDIFKDLQDISDQWTEDDL